MSDEVPIPSTAEILEAVSGRKLTDAEKLVFDLQDMHQDLKELNESMNPQQDIEDALAAARFMPSDEEIAREMMKGRR